MMRRLFALLAALALHGCAVMKPDMTDFTGVQLPDGGPAHFVVQRDGGKQ